PTATASPRRRPCPMQCECRRRPVARGPGNGNRWCSAGFVVESATKRIETPQRDRVFFGIPRSICARSRLRRSQSLRRKRLLALILGLKLSPLLLELPLVVALPELCRRPGGVMTDADGLEALHLADKVQTLGD